MPVLRFITFACLFVAATMNFGARAFFEQPVVMAANSYVPTNQYERRNVEGWTILVNKYLLTDQAELGHQALDLIGKKLRWIRQTVPAHACFQLLSVPIWLGVNDGHAPCSEYHASAEWLRSHGYNPDKAQAVEIGNAGLFVKWSEHQPMLLFHELAHSYQDRVFGWQSKEIEAVYLRAVQKGLYKSVPYFDGSTRRAYALTDEREYFAECSEAYFGCNDFYPFTRSDLERYDPEMTKFLKDAWGR